MSHRQCLMTIFVIAALLATPIFPAMSTAGLHYNKNTPIGNVDAHYYGEFKDDSLGGPVRMVGDLNGDKIGDLAFVARGYDHGGLNQVGKVYIFFGRTTGWGQNLNVSNANASFRGVAASNQAGRGLSGGGDVNGDGYDDLVIGAYGYYDHGSGSTGILYIIFGKESGWGNNVSLANADVTMFAESGGNYVGYEVAIVGDVNGDGYDDILVGAHGNSEGGSGRGQVYLIFGREKDWPDEKSMAYADASFHGEVNGDYLGNMLSYAGDVNNDGYDDFLISSFYNNENGNGAGKVYLIMGKPGGWSMDVNVSTAATATYMGGYPNDRAGHAVAPAGDINGDSYDDFLIGAYGVDFGVNNNVGAVFIVFGKGSGWSKDENISSAASIVIYGEATGDYLGWGRSCIGTGDVDGDGYDDLVLGAWGNDDTADAAGKVYLIKGAHTYGQRNNNVDTMSSSTWLGTEASDNLGASVHGGYDVELDGYPDITTGATNADNGMVEEDRGQSYVVFPDSNSHPTTFQNIKVYSDPSYSTQITNAKKDQTIYLEVTATNLDTDKDVAMVGVNTSKGNPVGILVRLMETGPSTGTFRGPLKLSNRTRDGHGWLKAVGNETLTIWNVKGTPKSATIYIRGDLRIEPSKTKAINATEDEDFSKGFWAEGTKNEVWACSSNATWLSFNSATRFISGHPTNKDVGVYWVNLTITDDYDDTASLNFTLRVNNVPPKINQTTVPDAVEDEEYGLDLNSTDDGCGDIMWSIDSSGGWAKIDSLTGLVHGTPTNDHVGANWINVTVDDGNGGQDSANLTLTVLNSNDAPIILTEAVVEAIEDEEYLVYYAAEDVDAGDTLKWAVDTDASGWLTIDEATGLLSGTPVNDDVGSYQVNVTVTDTTGVYDFQDFTLNVSNVNDAPVIVSQPVLQATALIKYKYTVIAEDVDAGDTIEYILELKPEGMTIDPVTGNITWIPTREQGGEYTVAVRASDGEAQDLQTFDVKVEVPVHYPPVVTLETPLNGSRVNDTLPQLAWSYEDPDSSLVFFDLYLSDRRSDVEALLPVALKADDITETVFIPKLELMKGMTYYWTVVPFDGEYTGKAISGIWSFTIRDEAVASKKPTVVLNSPMDGASIRSLPVQLQWSGADPDSDVIYYDLYLGNDLALVQDHDPSVRAVKGTLEDDHLMVDGIKGRNYFWTVVPSDGENTGPCISGVWQFKLEDTAVQNHPPVFNSTPVTVGYADQGYEYQVLARDEDGDKLTFSLRLRPQGMVIDTNNGLIVWNPTDSHIGNHQVIVRVSDGKLYVEQNFTVEIKPLSDLNHPPSILSVPVEEATVGRTYKYQVAASDLDSDTITFAVTKGPKGMTIDSSTGLIRWTPKASEKGENEISITISDGKVDIPHNFTVTVKEASGEGGLGAIFPWLLLLVIIIVVVALAAVASRKKKRRDEALLGAEEAEVVEEEGSADAYATPAAGGAGQQGAVPYAAPVAVAAIADDGVEDFEVSEVFLIYHDGRLITHSTVRGDTSIDMEIMSGMLVAIQGFVKESFAAESGLDSFEFSGRKAILQGGNYVVLAAVIDGTEPHILREEMRAVISKVEGLYAGVVENWDGTQTYFSDVRQYLMPLFRLKSHLKIKKKKKGVKVKSGVEFYSGYVRLKVGVSNDHDFIMGNIDLTLDYDHSTLRFSHIEPEYPISGSTIYLPDVHPSEKRTVAVYFDPIICQESHIDGWVTYTDPEGAKHDATMKRRPVDIVCPIFYTIETVNVAMLKRLLGELGYSDSRLFEADDEKTLKEIYDIATSTVKAHDVKFVREFKEEAPISAESWFYGEVKETDERLVIKVSATGELDLLDIFVASSNLASMTGLLAELGSKFQAKVEEKGYPEGAVVSQIDEEVKDVLSQVRLLLDKYADGELDASDTETDK